MCSSMVDFYLRVMLSSSPNSCFPFSLVKLYQGYVIVVYGSSLSRIIARGLDRPVFESSVRRRSENGSATK